MRNKLKMITSLLVGLAMVLSLSGNIRLFAEESDENTLLSYDYLGTESDAVSEADDGFIFEEEDVELQGGPPSSTHFTGTIGVSWRDNWGTKTGLDYAHTFKGIAVDVMRQKGWSGYDCSSYVSAVLRANGELGSTESFTSSSADSVLTSKGYKALWSSPRQTVDSSGTAYVSSAASTIGAIRSGDILVWYNASGTPKHVSIGYIYDGWIDPDLPKGCYNSAGNWISESFVSGEVCVLQSDGTGAGHMTMESVAMYLSGATATSYGSYLQIYRKAPNRASVQVRKTTSDGSNLAGVTFSLYKVSNGNTTYLESSKTALGRAINLSGATDTVAADNGNITKIATFVTDSSGVGIPSLTYIISDAHSGATDPFGDWYNIKVEDNTVKGLPLADYILVEDKSTTDSDVWAKGGAVNGIVDVNGNAVDETLGGDTVRSSWTVSSSILQTTNGIADGTIWSKADMGTGQGEQFYIAFGADNTFSNNTNNGVASRAFSVVVNNEDDNEGLKLKKSSSNPTLTNNNSCYSLSGAVYAVYDYRWHDSVEAANENNYSTLSGYIGALTTDASGNTNVIDNLNAQNYYVKEVIAPKGYALDDSIYTIDMTDSTKVVNGLYTLSVQDTPQMDPITIALYKKNSNGVGIADAQYTVKFYEGEYPDGVDPATLGKTANRSWVLKTDSSGQIRLDDSYKISGSDWYIDSTTNQVQFPLGTVTIQETKAPSGYLLDNTVYVRRITTEGNLSTVHTYNAPTITENAEARLQVKKTSTEPTIIDLDSSYSLAGAVYAAYTSADSANSATKDNYTSIPGYTGAMTTDASGLSNKLTGLNPGTYYVKEVKAPYNFKMDATIYTVDLSDPLIYADNTYIVESAEQPDVHIGTRASDIETNDNVSNADTEVIIKDLCSYTGLEVGKSYTVKGELMLKSTGEPLLVNGLKLTAEKTFTADVSVGTVELTFPAFDASELAGKSVVVFEKMYHNDIEVAVHTDINSVDQTISFPDVKTTASDIDTNDNVSNADAEVTITDKVSCTNLIVGKEYTIKGVLMDKATNAPLLINDAEIRAEKTFTATEVNPVIDITFPGFDGSELAGTSVVVFETMYHNDIEVAAHMDIKDKEQEISFPDIKTTASDIDTNDNVSNADAEVTITDKVSCTNLIVGKEYTVKGELMLKSTGEPLLIDGLKLTAEKTFTAEEVNPVIDITFPSFDGSELAGKSVVVFETMYHNDIEVAAHADIKDEEQTIHFPDVETTASEIDTEDHIANADKEVTITDKVNGTNLVVGKEYTLKAVLMNKKTGEPLLVNGNEITAEKTFTAEEVNSVIDITFPSFDGSELAGTSVVVFETMYHNDIEVAVHTDISDKEQTIDFPDIKTKATNEEGSKNFAYTDKDTITLIDTVFYKNLLVGKIYKVSGILMDKATGKPVKNNNGIPIAASTEFTPEAESGETEVAFTIENASEILGGKTVVVFEDLSYNGVSIAVHADIEDKDQTVDFPKLGTSMSETVSGLSVVVPRSRVTLTDTVEYTNLAAGKTYILKGKLMDEETGEPFVDAQGNEILAEKEFTPTVASGSVEVTFEFNAKLNKAYKVVAFEECWDKEEKRLVCFHCDIEDDNQTVGFPDVEIKTTAAADGKKEVKPSKETKLVDRVSYSDLPVGYTYEVSGVIMDKTTGKELLIDGNKITARAIFTPATENGEIQVVYTLDTTNFTNRELVVFEEIRVVSYADGTEIESEIVAEHKDINDKGQTIKITTQPKTGDDTPIIPVVIVMLVCAGLGILIICCKKKRY